MPDPIAEPDITSPEWAALFGPLGLKGLLDAFSGGEPLVAHGSRNRLPDWMSAPVLSTADTLTESYRGRVLFSRLSAGPQAGLSADARAADVFRVGCALYLPDVAAHLPDAAAWVATLETCLGIPAGSARITAWVAPAGEGTSVHLDAEDVISIQLSGTKLFEIAEPAALLFAAGYQYCPDAPAVADLYPQVPDGFPDVTTATFQSIEMKPGSVLVLPRGHWHRTRCSEPSLALSIVLSPPTRLDWVLSTLRQKLLSYPKWRQPIYTSSDDGSALLNLIDTLPNLLTGIPFATALDTRAHLTPLPSQTTLQRVPHISIERVNGSWAVTDRTSGHQTLIDAPIEPTLEWLTHQSGAFTIADCEAATPQVSAHDIQQHIISLIQMNALYQWPLPRAKSNESYL